ncbi:MAG: cytidylate kinase family protein [Acidimicrobiales bacterium]|nr:cytidylate kinase family protein [Acidimicrobiales bacterium]HLV90824.1 cytidylate kinase family protein [Acidimicrobiia bacterium]
MSGRPGSGKSVVAKALAEVLSVDHVSAGDFMREMAAERGMSILELSRVAESDDAIDLEIDARTSRLAGSGRSFVMDARLGWHFIPHSVKVFLDVRPEVAAARVFGAGRSAEKENVNLDATVRAIAERTESERERYIEYYGIDYLDPSHYDLVVDTSDLTPEQVVERIVEHLRERDMVKEDGAG